MSKYEFIRHCQRCGATYDWRRSASTSLKMTYCGSLCERADLGFTVDSLTRASQSVYTNWRKVIEATPGWGLVGS